MVDGVLMSRALCVIWLHTLGVSESEGHFDPEEAATAGPGPAGVLWRSTEMQCLGFLGVDRSPPEWPIALGLAPAMPLLCGHVDNAHQGHGPPPQANSQLTFSINTSPQSWGQLHVMLRSSEDLHSNAEPQTLHILLNAA